MLSIELIKRKKNKENEIEFYEVEAKDECVKIRALSDVNQYIISKIESEKQQNIILDTKNDKVNYIDSISDLNYSKLEQCQNIFKLIKKTQSRINNFSVKHLIPLSSLVEDNFADTLNMIKNELMLFKDCSLEKFRNYKSKNDIGKIYDLKSFNYDEQILKNINYDSNEKMISLFFQIYQQLSKSKTKYNELRENYDKNTERNSFLSNLLDKMEDLDSFLKLSTYNSNEQINCINNETIEKIKSSNEQLEEYNNKIKELNIERFSELLIEAQKEV